MRPTLSCFTHRAVWLATLLLLPCLAMPYGCARTASKEAPYPHESVLAVVAELKIFLQQDPYRQPPGRDLNGRNIYRISLDRLQALRELTGEQYGDVIDFARGECLERLGDWTPASQAFTAAAGRGASLAGPARARAVAASRLAELNDRHGFASTLDGYQNDLAALARRVGAWQAEQPPFPYNAYLSQLDEQVRAEQIHLLFGNRLVLEHGAAHAVEAARHLTERHKDSWRACEHWLLLGSLYETLARDWTAQRPPESLAFKAADGWQGWVEQARIAYRHVAQTDGDPAKPEGQARLRALDAYAQRVLSAAQ